MSTLGASAKYLSEKGLSVTVVSSERLHVCRAADRAVDVAKTVSGYTISSWEHVPGPGEDDFSLMVAALDDALLIIWGYYFAKNIEISGWQLPVHRRPYWRLPHLQYRLANASRITATQFEIIREERRRRALADPADQGVGLAFAERTQFVLAGAHDQSGSRLFLRRDMEEGYVVADA